MRDEPEMRNCFQCEVSLNMSQAKKGILLVNDYSHEEFGTAELGRDAGIGPGQPEVNLVPRSQAAIYGFIEALLKAQQSLDKTIDGCLTSRDKVNFRLPWANSCISAKLSRSKFFM